MPCQNFPPLHSVYMMINKAIAWGTFIPNKSVECSYREVRTVPGPSSSAWSLGRWWKVFLRHLLWKQLGRRQCSLPPSVLFLPCSLQMPKGAESPLGCPNPLPNSLKCLWKIKPYVQYLYFLASYLPSFNFIYPKIRLSIEIFWKVKSCDVPLNLPHRWIPTLCTLRTGATHLIRWMELFSLPDTHFFGYMAMIINPTGYAHQWKWKFRNLDWDKIWGYKFRINWKLTDH